MANNNEDRNINITPKKNKFVQSLVNNINTGMDRLYKQTYMSTPMNSKDLNNIKNDFNRSLDKLLDDNYDSKGETNISALYNRASNGGTNRNNVLFEELFEDNRMVDGLLADFSENKRFEELDNEIDLILKFMPLLEDALDAKKDNVLSADNYNKDYINAVINNNVDNFAENIKNLKQMYDVLDISENAYDAASKYGEQFIYIDNYKDALAKLLDNKPSAIDYARNKNTNESFREFRSKDIICECFNGADIASFGNMDKPNEFKNTEVYVEFNHCCLESAVTEACITEASKNKVEFQNSTNVKNINFETLGSESIYDTQKQRNVSNELDELKVNGSIIRILERKNVIVIFMDNIVLGYYYFECETEEFMLNSPSYANMFSPTMRSSTIMDHTQQNAQRREQMLKSFSSQLSNYIDSSFINSNKDLKEEIYIVLKHNNMFNGSARNKIKVTFIPPDKMVHYCFEKDPKTHRGISDLEKSLLPAKIYVYLYLNDTIGALRSHDKRIYNVRNNVDTNIAQNLINAINQLQKGNMGARELVSMKTMLNITGRYNDIVVPVGPSGESPIDFQVMDGQQIDTKTDLMEMMQEMAVSATGVPYEYVQSRKTVDYAVRLTMASSKFLRKTFKRQAVVQKLLSEILTKLYNNEYEPNTKVYVEVLLPPPGFLQLMNTTQLFQSVNEQVESILNMTYDDEVPMKKRKIMEMKLKRHYLKGYLDGAMLDRMKEETEMEYIKDTNKNDQE